MEFEEKTVIVTGGGQGIGRAVVKVFAREGAAVVVAEIDPKSGNDTVAYINSIGGRALLVPTDVSNEESVRRMVDTTMTHFGAIHALCNNAAVEIAKDFRELDIDDWDRVLSVNLRSIYLCSRAVIPHLIAAGGGSIVNISSVQALASTGRVSAYAAAKGGVLSMTRDLAQDFAPYNIRINAICPGCIDTPMQDRALAHLPDPEDAKEKLRCSIPLRRTGKPEEIAESVLFLSSPRASYITGVALVVDGGLLTQLPIPR